MSRRPDLTGRPARRRKARLLSSSPAVCILCLQPIDVSLSGALKWGPTTEHLIPVSRGGSTTDPRNQALSHRICNTRRGTRTIEQARAELAPKRATNSRKWL